jgi:hypothetical protein
MEIPMSSGKGVRYRTRVLAVATAALLPTLAGAQASTAGQSAGDWQFGASIYGYLPTLKSKAYFPITGSTQEFVLDAKAILDNLKMTFMGAFEAHNGSWGVFTDVLYVDLGNTKSNTRDFTIGDSGLPAGATAKVSLDLKSWVWTTVGVYRVAAEPAYTLDVLAGARYLDINSQLDWSITGDLGEIPAPGRSGSSKVGGSNWDALVGVKGQFHLGEGSQWSLPVYLDVGTGESDLTWQGAIGVRYAFQRGEVSAMWRYLDYQFKDSQIEDLSMNGPLFGATFRW